jgi:hypothetical protein
MPKVEQDVLFFAHDDDDDRASLVAVSVTLDI